MRDYEFQVDVSRPRWTCDCGAQHDRNVNATRNLRDVAYRTVSSTETGLRADARGEERFQPLSGAPRLKQVSDIEQLVDSSRFLRNGAIGVTHDPVCAADDGRAGDGSNRLSGVGCGDASDRR